MDTPDETIRRIEELDRAIGRTPEQSALYMRRGRLLYRAGLVHRALNDFRKARELDGTNAEADAYIEMLQEIFDFRYTDLYNP